MRISDWSSDVCSSDLLRLGRAIAADPHDHGRDHPGPAHPVLRAGHDRVAPRREDPLMDMDIAFLGALLAATLRLAIPVGVAALGEVVTERSGVLNLGIEGTMLLGAFAGYTAATATGSPWMGLGAGIVVGLLAGVVLSALMVWVGTNQIITGLAFAILASAGTTFLFELSYTVGTSPPRVNALDLPELTVVLLLTLLAVWFPLEPTRPGLGLDRT